ncbi:MAG: MarR family transcriptional regulator [Pyrinomonadaceae bacterium]|nr:MarR family transcriptional regulator [Pyrinomonadaceae bacterium]
MLTDGITLQFSEAATFFRYEFDRAMKEIGLHGGQVSILLALYEQDGRSQIELAGELQVSAPTVSNMVKSLLAGRFVEPRKCELDARVTRIFLTDKANDLKPELNARLELFEESFFSEFTETERLMFGQLLKKLRKKEENAI